jgi:hypothetical protein
MATLDVLNTCLYCHKEYEPNIANHYCDDCVATCDTCDKIKGLWCFGFDYESEVYKIWKGRGAYGILPRAGHVTVCESCRREKEPDLRLKAALAKLKPGQLELMLGAIKKT